MVPKVTQLLVVALVSAHLVLRRRSLAWGHSPAGFQPCDVAVQRVGMCRFCRVPLLELNRALARLSRAASWLIGIRRIVLRMVAAYGADSFLGQAAVPSPALD